MNRFEGRPKQECRLFVTGRPSNFAIDALPVDVELSVEQNDCFGALTPRTRDAVLIEDVGQFDASSHTRFFGRVFQMD